MASHSKPRWPSLRERQSTARKSPGPQIFPQEPFWEDRAAFPHSKLTTHTPSSVISVIEGCSPLCEACRHFWAEDKQLNFRYNHIRLLATLQRAADDGCRFCALVRSKLVAACSKNQTGEELGLQLKVKPVSTREHLLVEGSYTVPKHSLISVGAASFSLALNQVPSQQYTARTPITKSNILTGTSSFSISDATEQMGTAGTVTRKLVKRWLQQCSMSHEACREQSAATRVLPMHLLDVRSARDGIMRLVDSHELHGTDNAYIVVTQDPDSESLLDLQDVVKVAEWWKINYLWIESLCVTKDPTDGFNEDQLNRNDVFRNSFLTISTIAASQAPQELYGCHLGQGVHSVEPLLLHCAWLQLNAGELENLAGSSDSQLYHCSSTTLLKDNIEHPLLKKQGKALRERLLSAKVLHCGAPQVFWECRELTASGTYPGGIPNCFNSGKEIQLRDLSDISVDTWNSIVTTCPRSHFESSREMESIFSDIAEVFSRRIDDEYVAGLWRSCLPFQLCWAVSNEEFEDNTGSPDYMNTSTPTWSWLSTYGRVVWPMNPEQLDYRSSESRLVKVLDISSPASQARQASGPREIEITVNGLIHPGVLEPQSPLATLKGNCSVRLDGLPRCRKAVVGILDQPDNIDAEDVVLLPLVTDKYSLNVGGLILGLDVKKGIEMNLFERSLTKYRRLGYFEGAQHVKELVDDRIDRKCDGPFPKTGENSMFSRAKWMTCTLI